MNKKILSYLKTFFEAFVDVGSGFFVALLVQVTIIPYLFDIQYTGIQSIGIVFIFMIVSMIRSTLWRRYFKNRYKDKMKKQLINNNYCGYCKKGN